MSQLYRIYQSNTFLLAKSIVVKFDFVNDHINRELEKLGYHIGEDPRTHKYYMNLAGEYHQADHDRLLRDTGSKYLMVNVAAENGYEQVALTKDFLHDPIDGNINLLNEYQLGSRYHKDLLTKYPQYENLIKGLLCPIDKEFAVACRNGMILSIAYQNAVKENEEVFYRVHPNMQGTKVSKLIEPQEGNLIIKLQEYIDKTTFRWFNGGYSLTDDLYVPYFLGILYSQLPAKIMNIRFDNVHTARVHRFHVREYLESHGELGKHVDVLPFEQIMYLYRNMRYLETNMGKEFTFQELIKNLFTPLNIPIAGYTINHDVSNMDGKKQLLPEARLTREHLNFKSTGSSSDIKTVMSILEKQKPIARENPLFLNQIEAETEEAIVWGGDDNLITKVLESEMVALTDPIPVDFPSMAFWMWGYTASRGWYRGTIFVNNPISDERWGFTPLNAFILAIYCLNKGGTDTTLEYVPYDIVEAHWIPASDETSHVPVLGGFEVRPTADQLVSLPINKGLTKELAEKIIGTELPIYRSNGSKDFYKKMRQNHKDMMRRYFDVAKVEELYRRGYAEHVFKRMYWHSVPLKLYDKEKYGDLTYTSFFRRIGISLTGFRQRDYWELFERLVKACIADSDDYEFNMKAIQRSVIEILQHFSSYATHFIYSINEHETGNVGNKYPRVTNEDLDGIGGIRWGLMIDLDVLNVDATGDITDKANFNVVEPISHGVNEITFHGGLVDIGLNTSHNGIMDRTDIGTMYDVDILDFKPGEIVSVKKKQYDVYVDIFMSEYTQPPENKVINYEDQVWLYASDIQTHNPVNLSEWWKRNTNVE